MSMYQANTDGPVRPQGGETAAMKLARANGYDAEVVHPEHYTNGLFGGIECWDFAGLHSYHVGNAIKYVWRHADKGKPLQDLRKAVQYVERASARGEAAVLPDCGAAAYSTCVEIRDAIDSHHLPEVYRAILELSSGDYADAHDRVSTAAFAYDVPEPAIAAAQRRIVESGGVLDLVGAIVTVPGKLLRARVDVVATGRLAEITTARDGGAAIYTLHSTDDAAVGPTRVAVESGTLVEVVSAVDL